MIVVKYNWVKCPKCNTLSLKLSNQAPAGLKDIPVPLILTLNCVTSTPVLFSPLLLSIHQHASWYQCQPCGNRYWHTCALHPGRKRKIKTVGEKAFNHHTVSNISSFRWFLFEFFPLSFQDDEDLFLILSNLETCSCFFPIFNTKLNKTWFGEENLLI